MFSRMPGERLSIRDNAAVGRFHGVSASNGQAIPQRHTESKTKKEESGCRCWFQKACPCCFRRQSSSYDVSGDVDGVAAGDGEKEEPTPLTPTGDTELDGEELGLITYIRFETSFHTFQCKFLKLNLFLLLSLFLIRVDSSSAFCGSAQSEIRSEQDGASHGSIQQRPAHHPQRPDFSNRARPLTTFQPKHR